MPREKYEPPNPRRNHTIVANSHHPKNFENVNKYKYVKKDSSDIHYYHGTKNSGTSNMFKDKTGPSTSNTTAPGTINSSATEIPTFFTDLKARYCWSELEITGSVKNISPNLFHLTHLTVLYLNDNNLTTVPPQISNLTHLTYLDLSSNKLRSLPPEIGDLITLRELHLNHNYLRTLPLELGRLFQLLVLGLKGNPLAPEILRLYSENNGTTKLLTHLLDNLMALTYPKAFSLTTRHVIGPSPTLLLNNNINKNENDNISSIIESDKIENTNVNTPSQEDNTVITNKIDNKITNLSDENIIIDTNIKTLDDKFEPQEEELDDPMPKRKFIPIREIKTHLHLEQKKYLRTAGKKMNDPINMLYSDEEDNNMDNTPITMENLGGSYEYGLNSTEDFYASGRMNYFNNITTMNVSGKDCDNKISNVETTTGKTIETNKNLTSNLNPNLNSNLDFFSSPFEEDTSSSEYSNNTSDDESLKFENGKTMVDDIEDNSTPKSQEGRQKRRNRTFEKRNHSEFSLMCYNILCDKYATRQLYSYCPTWALAWNYRKHKILSEILTLKPDIVCLQEVETEQFSDFFQPGLRHLGKIQGDGYDGIFAPKSRAKTMRQEERRYVDGCAIFYRRDRFELLRTHLVEFNQVAIAKAEGSQNMLNRVMTKDNIGLTALFRRTKLKTSCARDQSKSRALDHVDDDWTSSDSSDIMDKNDEIAATKIHDNKNQKVKTKTKTKSKLLNDVGDLLVVSTAHVHWDPEYSDVKIIQAMMIVHELKSFIRTAYQQYVLGKPSPNAKSFDDTGIHHTNSKTPHLKELGRSNSLKEKHKPTSLISIINNTNNCSNQETEKTHKDNDELENVKNKKPITIISEQNNDKNETINITPIGENNTSTLIGSGRKSRTISETLFIGSTSTTFKNDGDENIDTTAKGTDESLQNTDKIMENENTSTKTSTNTENALDDITNLIDDNYVDLLPLILCGDLNSLPDSGVLEYLLTGKLDADHSEFKDLGYKTCLAKLANSAPLHSNKTTCSSLVKDDIHVKLMDSDSKITSKQDINDKSNTNNIGGNKIIGENNNPPHIKSQVKDDLELERTKDQLNAPPPSLIQPPSSVSIPPAVSPAITLTTHYSHSFDLASAYKPTIMPYTNFTFDFCGVLDYILHTRRYLKPISLLGPLDQAWIRRHKIVGAPHPCIPSDHFPIMVHYRLRKKHGDNHKTKNCHKTTKEDKTDISGRINKNRHTFLNSTNFGTKRQTSSAQHGKNIDRNPNLTCSNKTTAKKS